MRTETDKVRKKQLNDYNDISSIQGSGSGFREYSSGDKQNDSKGTDLKLEIFTTQHSICKILIDREPLVDFETSGDRPKPTRKPGRKPTKRPPKNNNFSGDSESSGLQEVETSGLEESSGSDLYLTNTTMKLTTTEKSVIETSSKSSSDQSGVECPPKV